ncbi:MAG: hypothetical protein ACKO2Z_05990, partial [Sphaerospermopsis kisseleviana]
LTMSIVEVRQLERMIRLVMEGGRTHLFLTDEVEELSPEPTPHQKFLIATANPTTPVSEGGYTYGYGKFAVMPQRSDQNPRRHLGYVGNAEYKSMSLQFLEIPNIAVS